MKTSQIDCVPYACGDRSVGLNTKSRGNPRRWRLLEWHAVLSAAAIVMICVGSIAAEPAPNVAVIADAWKRRADAIRTARFVWTEEHVDMKGLYLEPDEIAKSTPESLMSLVAYKLRKSITTSGARVRYEFVGELPTTGAKLQPEDFKSTFDGTLDRALHINAPMNVVRYNAAFIRKKSIPEVARGLDTQPIRWTLWPLDVALSGIDLTRMRVTGRRGVIDRRECAVLEDGPDVNGFVNELWLDPDRNHSIVRYVHSNKGTPRVQLDVVFSKHATGQWLPANWSATRMGEKGIITTSSQAVVEEVDINLDVPSSEFDLQFPVGTVVNDYSAVHSGESGSSVVYLVTEGEGRRELRGREKRNVTSEQLLADLSNKSRLPWAGVWLLGGLAAVVGLLFARRKWRRDSLGDGTNS